VVLHRGEASVNTAKVLARKCALPVRNAEQGESLRPGIVYLAPPQRHLVVRGDRTLHLMDGRKIKHLRSSANPLFESAAYALAGRVIAVVLTGGGSDGTDGVQTVRGMGGVVIAQDPATAGSPSMPQIAIRTGAVDYVLSLDAIAPMVVRLVSEAAPR
jgi:two-component system chemotaxis response regulator CheB